MTADSDLLRAAKAGDHRAFVGLLRESDRVCRAAVWRVVGSSHAVDDVMPPIDRWLVGGSAAR